MPKNKELDEQEVRQEVYASLRKIAIKNDLPIGKILEIVVSEVKRILNQSSKPLISEKESQIEPILENPDLARFKADYDRWPDKAKQKCTWDKVQRRFLANDSRYLRLAVAMEQGGVLFGVDQQGNPLVADGGNEPILKGENYQNARKKVMFKKNETGYDDRTGYELFPYKKITGQPCMSLEISDFQHFTCKPFVVITKPAGLRQQIYSWLESGEQASPAYYIGNSEGITFIEWDYPLTCTQSCGVRRLLRLRRTEGEPDDMRYDREFDVEEWLRRYCPEELERFYGKT